QRNTSGGEVAALAGNLGGELLRHLSEHFREVDAALLEDGAVRDDARPPAAATLALPGVLAEARPAAELLQAGANAVLQLAEVIGGTCFQVHIWWNGAGCGLATLRRSVSAPKRFCEASLTRFSKLAG